MCAGPLRCRIGWRDELRHGLAGCAPCGLIQCVEILPYGAPVGGEAAPVHRLCTGDRPLLVGIGRDQAGVHRKSLAADEPLLNAAVHHGLEYVPKRFALPKTAMAVLREGRVIRYVALQTEPAKPA